MKYNQIGRSMVEMLGVLAIIAVLSVGGIAGYSKAMQMYKLNKWKSDFIMMVTNFKTDFISSRSYSEVEETDLTNFYKNLNIIPQSMLTNSNQDIFGNRLVIYARSNPHLGVEESHFTLQLKTLPNNVSVKQCQILFEFLKDFEDAWSTTLNEDSVGIGGILSVCGKSIPDSMVRVIKCTKEYNFIKIAQKCSVCAKQNCDIKLVINNGN